jgi:flagellar biosynthetic protein FliR
MDFMIEKLLGFVLVLTRVSAFFMILPVFGWRAIPVRVKVAMAIMVAVFFTLISPFTVPEEPVSELQAAILIANEAVYGLGLGLMATLLFSAVKLAGRFI